MNRRETQRQIRFVSGKVGFAVLLTVLGGPRDAAAQQAIISDHIPDFSWPAAAPGYEYEDDREIDDYVFEIDFRLDSEKFDESQSYSCSTPVPNGYWLVDRSGGQYSSFYAAIGGNGTLCWFDPPARIQIPRLKTDTCYRLTALRIGNYLRVSVLSDSEGILLETIGGGGTYRAVSGGVGIGKEAQGFHSWSGQDSFPGEISRVVDNGRVIDFSSEGRFTGGAFLGDSECFGSDE